MQPNKSELDRLVYQKCYNDMYKPLSEWIGTHPASLELKYSQIKYPDTASLSDMFLEFTTDVSIVGDTISFDAIVSCEIDVEEDTYYDRQSDTVGQWFRLHCSVVVEERIRDFTVHQIKLYSRLRQPKRNGAADRNLVPIIYLKDLDAEATRFLEEYYPEALTAPMPVPIEEIIKCDKLRLTLIKGVRLTDDFHIFGQICFSTGKVNVYDVFIEEEKEIEVGRGTILIDAMTYWERNLGCVNNTIAHEAFHWHRHRVYASVKSILRGENFIATRCLTKSAKSYRSEEGKTPWTDEERMEWQASHVAPRILMPVQTVGQKIEELYAKYGYHENETNRTMVLECVVDELADFYKVSKQSAKIRMVDLGYKEADSVYNYEDFLPYFAEISERDAFYEYCDNKEFRDILNAGLFRYVDGSYVIDDERFIAEDAEGSYSLTDYAKDNLGECALHFTYRRVDMLIHGQFHLDTFHRANRNSYERMAGYDTDKNASVVSNAIAFRKRFDEEFAMMAEFNKTFSQRVADIMKLKGWDARKFSERTKLEQNHYYRIKRGETENPDLETVLSICIGLQLPPKIRDELINLAGLSWKNTRRHFAYQHILNKADVKTVTDFNEAFAYLDVDEKPPLKDDA
ncbi:MAG: helix-turn-helix domain-containing protein [Oscillospiraceae bacterium]|jgi:transcriptional regulator with XRE-family HTH domain|nr:helix-turn-helix domain-containing protein [Oscillospiraceae bacterium]